MSLLRDVPLTLAEALDLLDEYAQVLDDRMTKAGHPAALVLREHRGTCPPYECSARCQTYRSLFVESTCRVRATRAALAERSPALGRAG